MNLVWNMIIRSMKVSRYILTILVVLAALTACQTDDSSSIIGKGKGRVVLGGVDIEIEATTRAYSIPTPSINDMIIEIIDPDNFVIESGHMDHYANGVDLFVATYTLRAYYGNKQQMGNSPYFEGTATFSIREGETTKLGTIIATMANAIITPNIPTDIIDHFTGVPKFYVSYGEQREEVTNGQSLYVLPGKYTLTLEGKNKAGIEIKKTITELDAMAQKIYNINCNLTLPTLTLPNQQAGAWAKRLYITPAIATDEKGNKIDTPQGITYELMLATSSDWSSAEKIKDYENKGDIIFTNLSPNTKYKVRAQLSEEITTNSIEITTENIINIPNGNLDEYSIITGKDNDNWGGDSWGKNGCGAIYEFYSNNNSNNSPWRTNNETKCPKNYGYIYSWSSRSGTRPDTDSKSNNCARIMTSGYGITGVSLNAPDNPKYSAIGRLYTDKVSCTSRPSILAFYYKYIPTENDKPVLKINIYNGNTLIGKAELTSPSYYTEYQKEKSKLKIVYDDFRTQATHYEIIFESGTNTSVSKYHSDKNGVMPMFIGSQLFIDEVELIYE